MAKYQLTPQGVRNNDTGSDIPEASGNVSWEEYLIWVGEGNVADPDPNDYLAIAKEDKNAAISREAETRILAGTTERETKRHNKRLTKVSKGQNLTDAEDLAHDLYDEYLDWVDLMYDAVDLAADEVELATTIEEVEDVTVTWPIA